LPLIDVVWPMSCIAAPMSYCGPVERSAGNRWCLAWNAARLSRARLPKA
jgi:hypothetical protein